MVSIPALEANRAKDYVFFIGEPVGTVALWKRYGELDDPLPDEYVTEYPVFQNTRGRGIWNTEEAGTTNQDIEAPSQAFWEALTQIQDTDSGEPIDVEDCAWYEREVISSLLQMFHEEAIIYEMGELLDYAKHHTSTEADA